MNIGLLMLLGIPGARVRCYAHTDTGVSVLDRVSDAEGRLPDDAGVFQRTIHLPIAAGHPLQPWLRRSKEVPASMSLPLSPAQMGVPDTLDGMVEAWCQTQTWPYAEEVMDAFPTHPWSERVLLLRGILSLLRRLPVPTPLPDHPDGRIFEACRQLILGKGEDIHAVARSLGDVRPHSHLGRHFLLEILAYGPNVPPIPPPPVFL